MSPHPVQPLISSIPQIKLTIPPAEPKISPASTPFPFSTNLCTLTPVVSSALAIVHWIGAAPRHRGKSDGWTLSR